MPNILPYVYLPHSVLFCAYVTHHNQICCDNIVSEATGVHIYMFHFSPLDSLIF